jgi:hypothetical protein
MLDASGGGIFEAKRARGVCGRVAGGLGDVERLKAGYCKSAWPNALACVRPYLAMTEKVKGKRKDADAMDIPPRDERVARLS